MKDRFQKMMAGEKIFTHGKRLDTIPRLGMMEIFPVVSIFEHHKKVESLLFFNRFARDLF